MVGCENLVLKGERGTKGGKGRSEIKSENGKVTEMAAHVPTSDTLGERYRKLMDGARQ